jgi:predicted ABC-type ATPase
LAGRIRDIERLGRDAANLEAVKRIETWLEASIGVHESVGVETVLSTDKYRRLVGKAKDRGFEIRLVYVVLQNPDLNVSRVRLRVKKGGHGVPEKKIRERWERSLAQLPWFLRAADWALLLDNSADLRVIGRKVKGIVTLDPAAPEAMRRAIDNQADSFR